MADLAVADELIVDVEIEAGVNALEVDVDLSARKIILAELEIARIERRGIDVGNVGRVNGVGVVYVGVVRCVVTFAENCLPGARNRHFVESAGREALCRKILDLCGNGIEFEIPVAAKREEARACRAVVGQRRDFAVVGYEIRTRFLATVVQNLLGFVEFVFKAHSAVSLNNFIYIIISYFKAIVKMKREICLLKGFVIFIGVY